MVTASSEWHTFIWAQTSRVKHTTNKEQQAASEDQLHRQKKKI